MGTETGRINLIPAIIAIIAYNDLLLHVMATFLERRLVPCCNVRQLSCTKPGKSVTHFIFWGVNGHDFGELKSVSVVRAWNGAAMMMPDEDGMV